MTNNIETKHTYTADEAELLIKISNWLKAVTELKESEVLNLDYLAVSNVKRILDSGAKNLPNKLIFPYGTSGDYLSTLLYQVKTYLRISKSLPKYQTIPSVKLAESLEKKLDEDYNNAKTQEG